MDVHLFTKQWTPSDTVIRHDRLLLLSYIVCKTEGLVPVLNTAILRNMFPFNIPTTISWLHLYIRLIYLSNTVKVLVFSMYKSFSLQTENVPFPTS